MAPTFFIQNIENEITWMRNYWVLFEETLCCFADDGHCCLLTCPVEVTKHAECIGIGLISVSKSCFSNKYLIQYANRKGSPPLGFVSLKYCTCSPWFLRQFSWVLFLKGWAQRCCSSLWSHWYSANFRLIVHSLIPTSCEIVLWNQLVYFQRKEGIVFGTQDNLLFSGLTVSSLKCQALWGGETPPVLVRTSFLLIHMVLRFPASGAVPAAFSSALESMASRSR